MMERIPLKSGLNPMAHAAKPSLTLALLIEAIKYRSLPWIEDNSSERLLIPRPTFKEMMAEAPLPDDVEIMARPLRSRRVIVRDRPNGLQIVSARWPEDGVETKRFPLICCVIRGTADLRLGNYVLRCSEGCFLLIDGSIPHPDGVQPHLDREGEESQHQSCDILWFSPIGELLKCWICRSENSKHFGLPTVFFKRKNLSLLYDAIFEELENRSAIRNKIRKGLLIALMSSVQNEIQEGRYFRWLPEAGTPFAEETDPVTRAHSYIRQHLSEPLTMENVARHCYMSRSQFAKVFRAQTGETFNQFVTRCRLEEAKLRLRTTTAQVAGIARHVGLKPRHFNELIRLHTGMTPGNYRRQHRDEANSW